MSGDATPAELQRLLGTEFGRQGWEYDLTVGRELVEEIVRRGTVDAAALARKVSSTWLELNGATRDDVAAAIERAIGRRTPTAGEPAIVQLTVNNQTYSLHMEAGAQITGSPVNVGGTQINVQAGTSKEDVLAGIGALVRAGLDGDWNPRAASELAAAVDARDDIELEDVEGVVVDVAGGVTESPDEGRVRGMLRSITEQGLGGALATGISVGLGALIRNPPF